MNTSGQQFLKELWKAADKLRSNLVQPTIRGSGIGRIKAMCREAGNSESKIQERGDFVDCEFYRLQRFDNAISEAGLNPEKGGPIGGSIPDEADLTERQQQVLALIKADSQMPYRKMAECMGINESALKEHLNKLESYDQTLLRIERAQQANVRKTTRKTPK